MEREDITQIGLEGRQVIAPPERARVNNLCFRVPKNRD